VGDDDDCPECGTQRIGMLDNPEDLYYSDDEFELEYDQLDGASLEELIERMLKDKDHDKSQNLHKDWSKRKPWEQTLQ